MENIVSDNVKEMMAHIDGGKNNSGNKSVWVKAVKVAVKEYQQRIQEDSLPERESSKSWFLEKLSNIVLLQTLIAF